MNTPGQPDDPLREHPADDINPRDFILQTPMGTERIEQLKELMPSRAKYGEFWVPYCAEPGSYEAGFAEQSNYKYFAKKYPWLHRRYSQLGLDEDSVEGDDKDRFEQFLIEIPGEDWDAFIEDVGALENYPDIDEEESSRLRMEAETEYWESDGFKDWLKAARKKFRADSYQLWVLEHIKLWDAYAICTDDGSYMEEEGGGHIWMNEEKAVADIDFADIEAKAEEGGDLRLSYEQAKEAWWRDEGGELFFNACQQRSAGDARYAAGLASLTDERLKRIYDRVVTDENSGSDELPAYVPVRLEPPAPEGGEPEAGEVQPAPQLRLVVSLKLENNYINEAATMAAELAHSLIAAGSEPLLPLEHPELPMGVQEGQEEKDFILRSPVKLANSQRKRQALERMDWGGWWVNLNAAEPTPEAPFWEFVFDVDPWKGRKATDPEVEQAALDDMRYVCEWHFDADWKEVLQRIPSHDHDFVYRITDPFWNLTEGIKAGRQTSAADKWIPKDFAIDDEFGCLTAAESLADAVPNLRFVVGKTRLGRNDEWGDHAWCVAPDGTIVDPYFRSRFPEQWQSIVYREDPSAFDRVYEAKPIPDPYDPNNMGREDVRDWILSGGPDHGELLWNSDKLYVIIPSDQETLDKYVAGQSLGYGRVIVVVPDPHGRTLNKPFPYILRDRGNDLGDFRDELEDDFYGAELKTALTKFYREQANQARREHDDSKFRDSVLILFQIGGYEALKGYYQHLRPGQVYQFDIKYGLLLIKRGRLAAGANRLGVNRKQITREGYLFLVDDWSDCIELFAKDSRKAAEMVFNGETYDWLVDLTGDLDEALNALTPPQRQRIRELLVWTEMRNPVLDGVPFIEGGEDTVVLQPNVLATFDDDAIDEMLKAADEFDYDGRVEEIAEALKRAHVRAQETVYNDGYFRSYSGALESVLGKPSWLKVPGKEGKMVDKMAFLIPWNDIFERLKKAEEDEGDYEGSLDNLVESYSEPAKPGDDPDCKWDDMKQWLPENIDDELSQLKPLPPKQEPLPPGQQTLPLGEALLMEGYDYGCVMADLPPDHAQFILDWGKTNIPDDLLYNPPDDDTMGREDEIHTTVKYGLETKGFPEKLRELVGSTPAFPLYVGTVSFFHAQGYDVVKLSVESPWLRELNRKIKEAIPCPGDKHPEYNPHITIAYVKTGTCDHLEGSDLFEAEGSPSAEVVISEVRYTGPGELDGARVKEKLPLSKEKRVVEALEPKDFISANAPRQYLVVVDGPSNRKWYRGDMGWVHDLASAKRFTPDEVDNVMDYERSVLPLRQDAGFTNLRLEIAESLEPKDFIIANAPTHRVVIRRYDTEFYFRADGDWRQVKEQGTGMPAAEAEAMVAELKPRVVVEPGQTVDIYTQPIAESVDPKEFIDANAPTKFIVTVKDPMGAAFYYTGRQVNSGWHNNYFSAKRMTEEEAERVVAEQRENWFDKSHISTVPRWTDLAIKPVLESQAKDFIMQQPALAGWHVKITMPLDDLFGGRPKNRPYYFQDQGRLSHDPGDPLPLAKAEQLVDYLKQRYGPPVFKHVELVPVPVPA